jgi:hypothetical protein
MEETIQEIKEMLNESKYDGIMFVPSPSGEGWHIESFEYKNPGQKLGGSSLGDEYEIILFTEDDEGTNNEELFSAILIDPLEYVVRMIKIGYYGIVGKKTTTSESFFNDSMTQILLDKPSRSE